MTCEATRYRTFQFRLHPTYRQTQALGRQLDDQRELYNAALQERIGAWKLEHSSVTFFDQCHTLTGLGEVRPEVLSSGVVLCRGTLKRLDRAFAGFFRRCRAGHSPGFPRFKPARSFHSLQWEDRSGWKVKEKDRRLYLMGIGYVRANYHRPINGTPKAITVTRHGNKWWLSVCCVDVPAELLIPTGREVGIDLGVTNLIATSDGEILVGEQFGSRAQAKLSEAQRSLATKQRGSNHRTRQVARVAQLHRRVVNQRRNSAHQLSRQLVNNFDLIVLEDLSITNMVRAPKAKSDPNQPGAYLPNGAAAKAGLNRSKSDAGWGALRSCIVYKAESAGRTVVTVDPRHTSQQCARCGHIAAGNRVTQAVFRCLACGHTDHADVNAARNILRAGRARLVSASVGRNEATTLNGASGSAEL